ncbi:hypothetical protein C475_05965 [Halosimplex carlsbadense 2-9-1]|uniref:Lipoprotein n=1 Tax=Halosimplex carlsbadense 2-9-1 TaxID=797114 RepID=M0CW28_9EURY|nr:hypothetical protein [Halosimplex carlsbadense]ELZ27441.1 hypothetical protein C475_05965 [Halosimplex carlsbadense 2-9-1]
MDGRALVVVGLVVLAGCSIVADGGDSEGPVETLTPAPVPTTAPTDTVAPSPLPPGVTTGGTISPSALASAHVRAVTGRSYVWAERRRTLTATGDGNWTEARNRTRTVRLEDGDTYRWSRSRRVVWTGLTLGYQPALERYSDGDTRYVREQDVDGPLYRARPATNDSQIVALVAANRVQSYLSLRNVSVSVGQVDGQRRYWVESDGGGVVDGEYAANYSVGAVVTPDGFVRRLSVSYTTERRGTPTRIEYEYAYRQVGNVSVTPPDWIDEARAAVDGEDRATASVNATARTPG